MILYEEVFIFLSVFFTVYSIIKVLPEKRNSSRRLPNPPSLPSLPLIGSLPFLRNFNNISVFFMEKSNQLGPLFTFRVGSKLILTLNTKEVIEEALVKNSRCFSSRPGVYAETIVNPNRRGITFMETNSQWKRDHQTSLTIMKEFGFGIKSIMEERTLNEILAMVKCVQKKQGQSFDPNQLTVLVSSNIITDIVFGHRHDYDLGASELVLDIIQYAHNLDMVFDIAPFLRFIPPFNKKLAALASCKQKIYDNIQQEIANSLENEVNCFVCSYIEKDGPDYDREQLNYMVRDIIAAGSETTSSTFQWMFIALANNPQVQERLHNEIDSVISRDRLPTLQDQSKLPYHEATILEILRWRTLVTMSVARLATDDSVVRGYFIPAGTLVLSNLAASHYNETVWKDPDVFRPERFLDKDNRVVGRDRVISFGLGRRSCFGEIMARAELFLFLASVAQRFVVLPPEGRDKVNDKPKQPIAITTLPEPFSIRLIDRE